MVWGMVIDGRLAHVESAGVRDRSSNAPVTAGTEFRIASMTKSFTVLAILKLRDEGKLSLEDPVSKWIPEFARMELPTRDSAPLRIRQLLSHSTGFPEDNPWGDQQLSASDADLTQWLRRGIPFSTPPGTRYEYSNYAFGLLGRVVTKASGMPYEKYVRAEILAKLHMDASTFRVLPSARRSARGGLSPPAGWNVCRGAAAAARALSGPRAVCSPRPRISANTSRSTFPRGRRATTRRPDRYAAVSVREMSHMWTPSNLTAARSGGALQAAETGYGYGLRISTDCRFEHIVGHGGGLPGFGSYMAVASRLRRRNVCHGQLDVCWAVRAHQPGVGCPAEDRRAAEARVARFAHPVARCAATSSIFGNRGTMRRPSRSPP